MTNADHGFISVLHRHVRRHRRAVAGAAGLAAVLGAGALVVTGSTGDDARTRAERVALDVPYGSSSAEAAPAASGIPAAPGSPASPATAQSMEERLNAARTANKRLGTEVRHQLPELATDVDPAKVHVEQTGSDQAGKSLRVSSARQDLTGYRELAWTCDGHPSGDAVCTNKVTTSPQTPARPRPTLLVCWRLSAKKSVYTVAVDFKAPPAESVSVAALDRAWKAMR